MTVQATRTYASICGNKHGCEASRHAGCLTEPRDGIHPANEMSAADGAGNPDACGPDEGFRPESRSYCVGSLGIFLGYNGSDWRTAHSGAGASFTLDDWMLVYRRGGDELAAGGADGQDFSSPVRLVSASCPAAGWNPGGEIMVIHFPRSTFRGLGNRIEAICAGRTRFAASSLLVAYLDSLWHFLPMLQKEEQHVVEAVTNQLVRSCIVRTEELQGSPSRPASRNRLESAKRYIDERISSPGLSVENVQGWLGVSRRQLYSLFESYGGVASYILRQRLRKIESAVTDPLEKRPIGRIAEQYGLDPARVERLFRERLRHEPHESRWDAYADFCMAKDAGVREARVS